MAKGDDPFQFILADYTPKKLVDFNYRAFAALAEKHLPDDVPAGYITLFYKKHPRETYLPLFIKLYKEIISIYDYIVKSVGSAKSATQVTGPPPKLLVTDAEFSVVTTEHDVFVQLGRMQLDDVLKSEEGTIQIAAVLLKDKVGARELVEFLSAAKDDFAGHWEHIQHILRGMYTVACEGLDLLFDFNKSERVPPIVPADKARRYKMQVDLKRSKAQIQSRLARIEQFGFHKNEEGFLRTAHGTYLITYFGDSAYFEHVDGYAVNDKLEIRIVGEN
jgi:hypothetical protein